MLPAKPTSTVSSHQWQGINQTADTELLLKRGIWAYFLLIVFEGALRKWFLPFLATPLLVVRDPLAIWLLVLTWKKGLLPENGYLTTTVLVGFIGIFTAVFLGHGNLPVAIFGARILLIHFPLVFVIGRIFSREDVVKMGIATLWIAIPMTILIALQFYSPQSAWVNRGVGGDTDGAGFDGGALGYFRPPGTFSFTNGVGGYYSLVAPYVLYFWFNRKGISLLLLVGATASLLAVIPLSISRTLLFQVVISVVFLLAATARQPKYLGNVLIAAVGVVFSIALLSTAPFFKTAVEVFTLRLDNASGAEGGIQGTLGGRYFGELLLPFEQAVHQPFFGYGLGMGTNVGSMLLTGDVNFLIAEGEWGRLIGEMGPLLGILIILVRLKLCLKMAVACYKKLAENDFLPWLLLSYGLLIIPQGQWAVPTSLGFSTLVGGLIIASLRDQSTSA
jgi:hypothetical protein